MPDKAKYPPKKQYLLSLGIRISVVKTLDIIKRINRGDSPYKIAKAKVCDISAARKIAQLRDTITAQFSEIDTTLPLENLEHLYIDEILNLEFPEDFPSTIDEVHTPFNQVVNPDYEEQDILRYLQVKEAKGLATESMWNMTTLKPLGFDIEHLGFYFALKSLEEYSTEFRHGRWILREFEGFPVYLHLHYELYLKSIAPDIPPEWLQHAILTILMGATTGDRYLKIAGKGLVQFRVWDNKITNRRAFIEAMQGFQSNKNNINLYIQNIFDKVDEEINIRKGKNNG